MPRPTRRLIAAIGLSTALVGCAQPAHVDTAIGSIMTPGNTQVPLPPGDWRQIATQRHLGQTGTDNNNFVEVAYALVENGRVKSLVNIFTSTGAPGSYTQNPDCERNSYPNFTYLHDLDGNQANNSDCVKVEMYSYYSPNLETKPFYKELYRAAAELGGLPRKAIRVTFSEALNFRYLNYNISFFPERDGAQGDNWRVGEEGAVEKAYVDDIVSWAKKFRPAVRNGVQNQLQ